MIVRRNNEKNLCVRGHSYLGVHVLGHDMIQMALDRQRLVQQLAEVLPLGRVAQKHGAPAAVKQRSANDNPTPARHGPVHENEKRRQHQT